MVTSRPRGIFYLRGWLRLPAAQGGRPQKISPIGAVARRPVFGDFYFRIPREQKWLTQSSPDLGGSSPSSPSAAKCIPFRRQPPAKPPTGGLVKPKTAATNRPRNKQPQLGPLSGPAQQPQHNETRISILPSRRWFS